ncbi:MAG: hypothetical protein ACI8S6_001913 [Myxococcota bacterium]|jgi:hypothetical protein
MAWNEIDQLKKRFHFICDVHWDDMDPTASPDERTCGRCDKAVFAALTEADFDHHASLGRCVFAPTTHGPALVAQPKTPGPPRSRPLAGAPRRPPTPEPITPQRTPDPVVIERVPVPPVSLDDWEP